MTELYRHNNTKSLMRITRLDDGVGTFILVDEHLKDKTYEYREWATTKTRIEKCVCLMEDVTREDCR